MKKLDVATLRVWTTERVVLMISGTVFFVAFVAGLAWAAVVMTGGV